MNWSVLVFWIFGTMALLGAATIAFTRNLLHAAFALFLVLFSVAGIYLLLEADFLAIAQVIVYVGGILILLMFGVLLTRKTGAGSSLLYMGSNRMLSGWILVLSFFLLLVFAGLSRIPEMKSLETEVNSQGITRDLGVQLLTRYLLPFEAISFLLLAALAGATWMSRRTPPEARDTRFSTDVKPKR